MPTGARTQFQGGNFHRGRCQPNHWLDLRSREHQYCDETASENPGPCVPQRHRRIGESDDRKHGRMVLDKIRTSMSRPLRNRRARNTDCALHLPRSIKQQLVYRGCSANLQVNRVAFQFIVEGWSLNAEQFGCFFLIPAAFGQSLENCVPLQVIKSLHALAWQAANLGLL